MNNIPNIVCEHENQANVYKVLIDSEAFMASLQSDIALCRHNIYIQFMTYEGDAVGKAFSEPLITKAAEGIDVRLIVDAYSDHILSDTHPLDLRYCKKYQAEKFETQNLLNAMRTAGVQVKRTNPFGPLWIYVFFRDHKKIIILDERVAYLGGINISDHNFAWHDYMVRMEGPLVQSIVIDFLSTWNDEPTRLMKPVHDRDYVINQDVGDSTVFLEILHQIDCANHSIIIESPYLAGGKIEAALLRAAKRGVRITLILPYKVNISVYKWWLSTTMCYLDHPNIRFYGFQGHGGMTHAKLYLFDDKWASFGSLNVDELESMSHKEINVFSTNKQLVEQLKQLAHSDLAQSIPLQMNTQRNWRPSYEWIQTLYFHLIQMMFRIPTRCRE